MFLIVVSIQGINGISQAFGVTRSNHQGFLITGTFFNPAPFAGFLIPALPVALGLMLGQDTGEKINLFTFRFAIVAAFLLFLILPLTQSRAAWVAGATSCLYVLWHVKFKARYSIFSVGTRKLAVTLAGTLIAVCVYALIYLKLNSVLGRLLIWKISANMVKENIFTGVGYGQFSAKYMTYQASYFKNNSLANEELIADKILYPYNEYLKLLAEGGIPSLLLLLLIFLFLFRKGSVKLDSRQRLMQIIVRGALISLFIFGLFSYPSEIIPINITFFCFVALYTSLFAESKKIDLSPNLSSKSIRHMISIILIAVSIESGWYLGNQYRAYSMYNEAFVNSHLKLFEVSLLKYAEALPFLKYNGEFMANYGITLVQANNYQRGIETLNASSLSYNDPQIWISLGQAWQHLGQYKCSEELYWIAHYMVPNRFYSLYNLALLYEEMGQFEDAKRIATNILGKSIKVQSGAILEIRTRMKKILYEHK